MIERYWKHASIKVSLSPWYNPKGKMEFKMGLGILTPEILCTPPVALSSSSGSPDPPTAFRRGCCSDALSHLMGVPNCRAVLSATGTDFNPPHALKHTHLHSSHICSFMRFPQALSKLKQANCAPNSVSQVAEEAKLPSPPTKRHLLTYS